MNKVKIYDGIFVLTIFIAYYYILKLPIQGIAILHHDDAEALYHVLSLVQGKIPHLEDASHHSLGYVLPYYFLSYIFGFSEYLLRQSALLIQALTAFAIYLTIRSYQKRQLALICGLIYLSAREPWVNAFYPQYLMNGVFAWILYLTTKYIQSKSNKYIFCSFLVLGIGFVIDQRLLFLSPVPLVAAIFGNKLESLPKLIFVSFLTWTFPVFLWIGFLYLNGGLLDYIEQAFIYPLAYRSASIPLVEHLAIALKLHVRAINLSPILFASGAIGLYFLASQAKNKSKDCKELLYVAIASIFSILIITSFGGRSFDYYTIIWFPILSILIGHSFEIFINKNIKLSYIFILFFLVLNPGIQSFINKDWLKEHNYNGDGSLKISKYLRSKIKKDQEVFVWNSRFEPYVYLQKLAPTRFASVIFFQPDGAIKDSSSEEHTFENYEKEFINHISLRTPDWIIKFKHKGLAKASKASDFMEHLISTKYQLDKTIEGTDILNQVNTWEAYKLR